MRTKTKYAIHVRQWRAQQPLAVRRRGMMRPKTFKGLMYARYPSVFIRLPDGTMLPCESTGRVTLVMRDGSELSGCVFDDEAP